MDNKEQPLIEREIIEEKLMKKEPDALNVIFAKERTLLSRERTAIALAQLALGIAAFGFIVIRFFSDEGFESYIVLGIGFVVVSGWLFYHSYREYMHLRKQLDRLHNMRGHLDRVYMTEIE